MRRGGGGGGTRTGATLGVWVCVLSARALSLPAHSRPSSPRWEEKIKCYGCFCWTNVPIVSDLDLVRRLGCEPWDAGGDDADVDVAADGPKNSCIIYVPVGNKIGHAPEIPA